MLARGFLRCRQLMQCPIEHKRADALRNFVYQNSVCINYIIKFAKLQHQRLDFTKTDGYYVIMHKIGLAIRDIYTKVRRNYCKAPENMVYYNKYA